MKYIPLLISALLFIACGSTSKTPQPATASTDAPASTQSNASALLSGDCLEFGWRGGSAKDQTVYVSAKHQIVDGASTIHYEANGGVVIMKATDDNPEKFTGGWVHEKSPENKGKMMLEYNKEEQALVGWWENKEGITKSFLTVRRCAAQ